MADRLSFLVELFVAALLIGAATASISRVIARERGPLNVIGRTVKWIVNRFPDRVHGYDGEITWRKEADALLTCPICLGVYVSTLLTLIVVVVLGLPFLSVFLLMPASLGAAYALLGLGALWQ